jgi:membrane-bound metal-dependent hydrolase YbcI (DUF457 family)
VETDSGGERTLDNEKHAILGALIAGGGYLGYKLLKQESPDPIEAIISLVGGAIAGVVPDILEPATHPGHRSLFHSPAILALIAQGNRKVWQSEQLTESQKTMLSLLSAAYASHLVADGTTPKGLPLLV